MVSAVFGGVVVITVLVPFFLQPSSASSKPNVLFLVVDDLRPKLGCYGETNMITPNIDQLAVNSIKFERAYVQQALCSPSRTSFLTGRRPDTTRTFDLSVYFRELAGNFTTLPQHFKENGYITQSVGKIFHPGKTSGKTDDYPYSWTYPARHAPSLKYFHDKICRQPDGEMLNAAVCPLKRHEIPSGKLPDEENTDFAIEFLHNRTLDKKPFFLALGYHKPHLPFRYPAEFNDLYPLSKIHLADNQKIPLMMPYPAYSPWNYLRHFKDIQHLNISLPWGAMPINYQYLLRQSYSAATSYMDALLGRVLEALDKSGFANNTIISFHGDHGWLLGEHMEWTKHTNFDLALRIPLMFHVPGVTAPKSPPGKSFPFQDVFAARRPAPVPAPAPATDDADSSLRYPQQQPTSGLVSHDFVEAVDIYATLSELAGLAVPPTCPPNPFNVSFCTEGASFAPLIDGAAKSRASEDFDARMLTSGRGDVMKRMALRGGRDGSSRVGAKWKRAVFSQYPRPSFRPSRRTIAPHLNETRIMGYTMRVDGQRYTEWLPYDPNTFTANWSQVLARELYDYVTDPEGNFNVADVPDYSIMVQELARQLRAGWRQALPGLS